jgi:hypothetical protein
MLTSQYSQSNFSLVQLKNSPPWAISTESPVTLSGGHGGEVVRSFCFLDEVCHTFQLLNTLINGA